MKLISRLRGSCFCAFCKSPRKVYVKKHVDLTNVVGASLLSMAVGQAYWGAPDPRALVLFCVTIVLSEIMIYLRWRASLVCTLCGFDPLIYKRSPQKASDLVKKFYQERAQHPSFWLSRSPLLERQRMQRIKERKAIEHKAVTAKILARAQKNAPTSLAPPNSP